MASVSFFNHLKSKGHFVPISRILADIKGGKYADKIDRLRELYIIHGKGSAKFASAKKRLPYFMVSCLTNGCRTKADVIAHSGLLQLDIDNEVDPGFRTAG
ncbi:hypothetical protein BH11VER1_BH11VER1_14160 [soil metagenome]